MNVLGAVAKGLGDVVLGSGPEDEVSEQVEALLERIATGFIPEDRALATTRLKELVTESVASRAAFGRLAFPVIREVVVEDASDVEAMRGCLELLHLGVRVEPHSLEALLRERGQSAGEEGGEGDVGPREAAESAARELDRASVVVAELFCRDPQNLTMLFGLLSTNQPVSDFYTRYNALKCLNSLLLVHAHAVQTHVLGSPTAVAKLMDLLGSDDSMEVERNESLLLLVGLCKANNDIQKLVVFEGCFDHIFSIVDKEQRSGVIAQDCLELLINLLSQNSSNQLMFRESGHLRRILSLLPGSDGSGSADVDPRVSFLALEALNVLMRPPSCASDGDLKATQDALCSANCDLLGKLVGLTCEQWRREREEEASEGRGSSYPVLGQAFRTLSCLLLRNAEAKDKISVMTTRWTVSHTYEDVPVLLAILLRALNSRSKFESYAALEVIESFCDANETGQALLASTVHDLDESDISAGEDASLGTFGTNLLRALSGDRPAGRRQAALVMSVLLQGSVMAKQRVGPGVLSKFVRAITGGEDDLLRQSVLKLLCLWLQDSQDSVSKLFASPSHVPLVVDLVVSAEGSADPATRGLASVVLGMCVLAKVETKPEGSFYTSSSVLDVVSKHVGLHRFFCAWEDMTASTRFKRGLFPPRTSKVITKREVDACFASGPADGVWETIQDFFGFYSIFSHHFCVSLRDLHPAVRQGVVSSYSGPDLNQDSGLASPTSVDPDFVRKLKDEVKQLRSRNESLATDLLNMSKAQPPPQQQQKQEAAALEPSGIEPAPRREDQVDKSELLASKAKQAELNIALRESDKRVDALERELRSREAAVEEGSARLVEAREESSKHENDLKDLSEAYSSLEEHSHALGERVRELEAAAAAAGPDPGSMAAAAAEAAETAKADLERRLAVASEDLERSRQREGELTSAAAEAERAADALRARVRSAEAAAAAAVAHNAKESDLAEARADFDRELRSKEAEHALEVDSLREQLQSCQLRLEDAERAAQVAAGKAYTEEELMAATEQARNEATADCDEEIFQLETRLRDMQQKLEGSRGSEEAAAAEAAERAREEAMAEADESMNDLLVCLGQEEKKTEVLRGRLEALGEDVDALLEGLEDDEDDED